MTVLPTTQTAAPGRLAKGTSIDVYTPPENDNFLQMMKDSEAVAQSGANASAKLQLAALDGVQAEDALPVAQLPKLMQNTLPAAEASSGPASEMQDAESELEPGAPLVADDTKLSEMKHPAVTHSVRNTVSASAGKCKHKDDAQARDTSAGTQVAAGVSLGDAVISALLQNAPFTNVAPVEIPLTAHVTLQARAGSPPGEASKNPVEGLPDLSAKQDAARVQTTDLPASSQIAGFVKDELKPRGNVHAGFAVEPASPSTGVAGMTDPVVQPGVQGVEPAATFHSSFLRAAPHRVDASGFVADSMFLTAEPMARSVNEGPVKHLEVSLHDADLGNISVRAEMRDGMLHASVLGGHADASLTAMALHQFLESSHVSVHAVQVETAVARGVQRTVSTAAEMFSSGGEHRDQREQREAPKAKSYPDSTSGEHTHWESPQRRVLPAMQRPRSNSNRFSIHI